MEIRPIAHIRTDFPEKFGIPRQSGLAEHLLGKIVFEEEFRNQDAFRGLEEFTHLWLIWEFSANKHDAWQPTVRPPRLGGNAHMGVFATRSPYRPNPLGLSCVEISSIELQTPEGPVIYVKGADLMDGTPIYDIKPYIRYADSHPEAKGGFTDTAGDFLLDVVFPEELLKQLPKDKREAAVAVLTHDPRPSYQRKPDRVYGLTFAGFDIRFKVNENTLTVEEIHKA